MSLVKVRVPLGKTGKFRIQHARRLKSGKLKFVKNPKRGGTAKRVKTVRSTTRAKRTGTVRNTAKGKMFRTLSGVGALEDVAWGFIGFTLLGKTTTSLPMTRAIQGIQGFAFDRRGKNRLVGSILDLASLWLAGGFGQGLGAGFGGGGGGVRALQDIQNLLKVRPL